MRRLEINCSDCVSQLQQLVQRRESEQTDIELQVRQVIAEVRRDGDQALLSMTARWDRLDLADAQQMELPRALWQEALASLPIEGAAALSESAERIRIYHQQQVQHSWRIEDAQGGWLGQQIRPLQRVGIYVPGGKAAYPSSVLMNAVPARVAGVEKIIMVVPTPGGVINPWVLAAAEIAGVDQVFRIGGAQAIAALAYGTATVPSVDKIVGPGNIYVATAKRQVFGQVGIDMIAGPSEILVFADDSAPADWLAMDLFSQAEHDEQAQSILLSTDMRVLDQVEAAMDRLLPTMQRRSIIEAALNRCGALIHVPDRALALRVINQLAPEHLQLACRDAESMLTEVWHAGAIFVGIHIPEALGDYCAGPNHVLPTSGTARYSSPLGVYDFQKRSSVIALNESNASRLAKIAATLAYAEGLEAHARSAEFRISGGQQQISEHD